MTNRELGVIADTLNVEYQCGGHGPTLASVARRLCVALQLTVDERNGFINIASMGGLDTDQS